MANLEQHFPDYEARCGALDHVREVRRRYLTRMTRSAAKRCLRALDGTNGSGVGLAITALGVMTAVLIVMSEGL